MILKIYSVLALHWFCTIQAIRDPVTITINPNKASHVLDPNFVSFSINPTELLQGKLFGMGSNATLEILKGLSPAYIRLGGPDTNHYFFLTEHHNPDDVRSLGDIIITESHWKELNEMLSSAGVDVIACINGAHSSGDKWNPKNAQELMEFSEKHHYNITWQFGYDAVRNEELKGEQLGKDISKLRNILNDFSWYQASKIVGPDIRSIHRPEDEENIVNLLIEAGPELDAITWHPRWPRVNAVRLSESMEDGYEFPPDYLEWDRNQLNKLLQRTLITKPLWIGEPQSENSGSFAEGLIWARRLAIAAKLGIEVVMKQPFLSDITHPKPEYWIAYLHKKMVGQTVLDTYTISNQTDFLISVQCTSKKYEQQDGGVTIYAINTASRPRRADVRGIGMFKDTETEVDQFILSADDIFSQVIYLNGEPLLTNEKGSLPQLVPTVQTVEGNLMIKLPPHSIGFWVVPQAKVRICQQEPQPANIPRLDDLSVKVLQTTQKGVNALRSINHLIVEQLLHPSNSVESKETIEGTGEKEVKRSNRGTDLSEIEEELKNRVQEIKDLLTFNLKGLDNKIGVRSETANNELRTSDSKIDELTQDLKMIMNAADQQKEFDRFLDLSGLNTDFDKKVQPGGIMGRKGKLNDEFDDDDDFDSSEEDRRGSSRWKRETSKEEESNIVKQLSDSYKQILAEQIKSLKAYPNALVAGEFGKINKEFQEELLLREISMLEKTEEQMLAAMEAHKKQHELMDQIIKDEVTQLKENKISALMDVKTDGLDPHTEEKNTDKHIVSITKKRQIEGLDKKTQEQQKPDPLSAIRSLLNKKKERTDHTIAIQEKLKELRAKLHPGKLTKLEKTVVTTTTNIPSTTEDSIITEEAANAKTHDQKRREEMLKSMADVIAQVEGKAEHEENRRHEDEEMKRTTRTTRGKSLEVNVDADSKDEKKHEEVLVEPTLQKILKTVREQKESETEPFEPNKNDDFDGLQNETDTGDELNSISNANGSVEELAEKVKKFRDGGNSKQSHELQQSGRANTKGETAGDASIDSLTSAQTRKSKSFSTEQINQPKTANKGVTNTEDEQPGENAIMGISKPEDEQPGENANTRITKPEDEQPDKVTSLSSRKGAVESAVDEEPSTRPEQREKRYAHDVEHGVSYPAQSVTEDVRESQNVLRNTILKKKFPKDDNVAEAIANAISSNDAVTLRPEQYLQLADTTMKIVLNDVIPAAYDKAREKLEEINLPQYLKQWNAIADNLKTLEKVLKLVTKEMPAAPPVSESIQKIAIRKKREAVMEIENPPLTENSPSDQETTTTEPMPLMSNTIPEVTDKTEEEKNDIQTLTPNNTSNNLENNGNENNTTLGPLEITTTTAWPETANEVDKSHEIKNAETNEDLLTQGLLNEAMVELVEEILKKGEKEVVQEIEQIELSNNLKEDPELNHDNLDTLNQNDKDNPSATNAVTKKKHTHHHEESDDPSTPWLESANRMIDELMANLQRHQELIESKGKGKREASGRFLHKNSLADETQSSENNDNLNEFLRNLRPGVYVVPSSDMTNVHADQSFKHVLPREKGSNEPHVVTLNIYYDKKDDYPKSGADVVQTGSIQPTASSSAPVSTVGGYVAPATARQPYSTSSWPSASPAYKPGLQSLSSLSRLATHNLALPRQSTALPAVIPSIPRPTPIVNPLLPKKSLYDSRHQYPTAPVAVQQTVPAFVPPIANTMPYQPPAVTQPQAAAPKYDDGYSILKQDATPYTYSQLTTQKSQSGNVLPTWSKEMKPQVEVERFQWPDDDDDEKNPEKSKEAENADSDKNDVSPWYVSKPSSQSRIYAKKGVEKNNEAQNIENKLKSIEPYWNRTLKEIFQETYNDPFWKFIKKSKSSSGEEVSNKLGEDQSEENRTKGESGKQENTGRHRRSISPQAGRRMPRSIVDWAIIPAETNPLQNTEGFSYPRIRRDYKMILNNVIPKRRPGNPLLDSDIILHDFLPKRELKHITDPNSSLEPGGNFEPTPSNGVLSNNVIQADQLSPLSKGGQLGTIKIKVGAPRQDPEKGKYSGMVIEIPNLSLRDLSSTRKVRSKRRREHEEETIVDPLFNMYETALGLLNNMSAFM